MIYKPAAPEARRRSMRSASRMRSRSRAEADSMASASLLRRSRRRKLHFATDPNNTRPHHIENVPAAESDWRPFAGIRQRLFIGDRNTCVPHPDIPNPQGAELIDDPRGLPAGGTASLRILIEKEEIVRGEGFWHRQIRREANHHWVNEGIDKICGKGQVSAEGPEVRIRARPEPMRQDGHGAETA